ncbi:hypothetical protein VM1G_00774 [Cytospora mali]|uniref:Uncharacterized protein n=1 Tax=Cytospora mali TaxID=578113 RepID=A0A194VKH4_CYTMA|nr:hypothetical protein VM1G_00774 [Valsa mali]
MPESQAGLTRATDDNNINEQNTMTGRNAKHSGGDYLYEAGNTQRGSSANQSGMVCEVLHLKAAEVDAIWQRSRLHGALGLYWDGSSTAHLRLHVSVNIISHPELGHKLHIYLYILPEHI